MFVKVSHPHGCFSLLSLAVSKSIKQAKGVPVICSSCKDSIKFPMSFGYMQSLLIAEGIAYVLLITTGASNCAWSCWRSHLGRILHDYFCIKKCIFSPAWINVFQCVRLREC